MSEKSHIAVISTGGTGGHIFPVWTFRNLKKLGL